MLRVSATQAINNTAMKIDTLKILLVLMTFCAVIPVSQAQFDDVYYDADQIDYGSNYNYSDSESYGYNDGTTYYDNDEYAYFDDYDYYYSSRIRRFYRPYVGFGFYDPCYVSYNYYDPYAYNYYGYPSASIYLGSGFGFGHSWNTWSSWNNYGYYGNGYGNGYGGYYGGNYGGNWGGYGGNCYNNYYACTPVSCYVPPVYYPVVPGGGGSNGVFYGPRTAGNTGTSPRIPLTTGVEKPGYKGATPGVTQSNDQPRVLTEAGTPGRTAPSGPPKGTTPDHRPAGQTLTKDDAVTASGGQTPIDRDITREKPPTQKRPVFKPDVQKFQPYPTPDRTRTNTADRPSTDRPSYTPYTPSTRPGASTPANNNKPGPQADRPADRPARVDDTPKQTSPDTRKSDRPSYTPPPSVRERKDNTRSSDQNSGSRYSPPPKSNNKPSYSPPSNSSRQGNSSPSRSFNTNRSSSPSSSGSRPSGGGSGSKSSTSPRGKG